MAKSKRANAMMLKFGRRLGACRISAGIEEQQEMAKLIGISAPSYRKYERGEAMPPIDVLEMICTITNRSADFILFGKFDGPKD